MVPATAATTPGHVAARDSPALAASLETLHRINWRSHDEDLGGISARSVVRKRGLDHGGIAGVVVGVIAAVALVALCLYPVIVGRRRRRQRLDQDGFDPETASVHGPGDPADHDGPQRRHSSQESFKPVGDMARGGLGERASKELGWSSHDRLPQPAGDDGPQQDRNVRIDTHVSNPTLAETPPVTGTLDYHPSTFSSYEYMPQEIGDAHNGVLKGTSADYYSPSIPSSAFGMYSSTDDYADAKGSLSRASSGFTVKYLFGRKSTRDRTGSGDNKGYEAPLQRITTNEATTESPVQMSFPEHAIPPPARALASSAPIASTSTPPTATQKTPPQSPPVDSENKFKASPTPPSHPAPGTVNPMDIMPAITDKEMYHRTEHQLYMSYNQRSPSTTPLPEDTLPGTQHGTSALSAQPHENPQLATSIQSPSPTQGDSVFKKEPTEEEDALMATIPLQNHLSPLPEHSTRHPSYPSDESTPLPGPASTNPSTLNTPATQLDSPSPNSEGLSDYRHSVSPNNNIGFSPSNGASHFSPGSDSSQLMSKRGPFHCDEPGCNQTFDQPHKLKHHQRYHTKEHKCPYPSCGKGFGTKTHLQRHINDRHEKKKKYHCAVPNCDYSRQGGKGFPRKDNWKRHMTKIHHVENENMPEPVEVDQEMSGV